MDEKITAPFVDKGNTLRVQAQNLAGMVNNLGLAKELATGSRVIDTCLGAARQPKA